MDTTTSPTAPPPTLYAALGGRPAVAAAVDALYDRLLGDPAIAPFFDGIEMTRLRGHMQMFLTAALGDGVSDRTAARLGPAHAHLGITDAHFDGVAAHLSGTLSDLGVEQPLIDRVIAVVAPLRAVIVAPVRSVGAVSGPPE